MMKTLIILPALLAALTAPSAAHAQGTTRADSLRGSIGPARPWWDVAFYDLDIAVITTDDK